MISDRIATSSPDDLEHIGRYTVAGMDLLLDNCSLTFDELQAPYAQLNMRSIAPETQTALDRLDPRLFPRVDVTMGYRFHDGREETERMASLGIDTRSVDRPANTLTLVAQGDERLVMDRGVGTEPVTFTSSDEAFGAIVRLIRLAIPNAPTRDDGTRVYGWVPADSTVVVEPGDNPISAVIDVSDRVGDLWTYADGLGVWHITRRPVLASTPFLSLTVGERGTIVKSTSRLSRDDWANSVLLRHKWREGDEDRSVVVWADVSTGDYRVGKIGAKRVVLDRATPIDFVTASQAATSLLRRYSSRGRTLTVEAVADYRLRPGHTISVQLPQGGADLHLVSAVTFEQPTGTMTIRTRVPDDAELSTGA
jgi:hypothetical protein